MGAFALVLVPVWLAFRCATGWRWTLIVAALAGLGGYLIAFVLALGLDQPLGPVLVAALAVLAGLGSATGGLACRSAAAKAPRADGRDAWSPGPESGEPLGPPRSLEFPEGKEEDPGGKPEQ